MPHPNRNIILPVFEANHWWHSLGSILFFFLCTAHLFAQTPKPRVSQLQFEVQDKSKKTLYQDTTGLMWILGPTQWYISDGEQIFEVPIPIELGDESYILIITQYGNRFFMGGDSVRIFNPYSRRFEKSIGLSPDIHIGQKKPYIGYPILLEDGSIFGVCKPVDPITNKYESYSFVLSKNGRPFQELRIPVTSNLRNRCSFTIRGNQLFVARLDTISQYDLNGNFVKTHTFEKVSSQPSSCEYIVSEDEEVSFTHYKKDNNTGELHQTRFILKPGEEEFISVDHPNFESYPGSFSKQDADYYKFELDQLELYGFFENEPPTNFTKVILNRYPDLSYYGDYIHGIQKDRSNTIWASSYLNGIFKFSNIDQPYTHYLSLQEDNPTNTSNRYMMRGMASDGKGNIYSAYDFGIKKLEIKSGSLTEVDFDLIDEVEKVNSLSYYKGKLYFNAMEIDPTTGSCKELIPNLNANVVTHYVDTLRNRIWLGDADYFRDFNDSVKLYQYDLTRSKLISLPGLKTQRGIDNEVTQFHLSPTTQTMFVTTVSDGIYELDLNGKILNNYLADAELPFRRCLSMYEDDHHQLWIGHATMSKLDLKTRELSHAPFYSPENKFAANQIYSIQKQNETYIWLATNYGIFRLNTFTGKLHDFKMISNISVKEYNRLSHEQDDDGNLYFGSTEGIFKFHPDDLLNFSDIDGIFPIRISRFSTYDNQQDSLIHHLHNLSNTFQILPNFKYFSFDIYSPDLRSPEKNKYSWWLEGYENTWSKPSTTNHIRYEKIPPGEYTLHVKGGLSPQYYDSSERTYTIVVHQVWYKTLGAIIAYLILFALFVFSIYRYQLKRKLTEAEATRLKELDNLKSRLYTNITHEFRTPLTVIMGMTDNIKGHAKEKKLIQRNSKNLLRLINQILDLSKLDSGKLKMDKVQADIIYYLQYLTESFYSMAEEKQIRLTFYSEIKELVMDFDEMKIQQIIYNLLTNAIKFTMEGGKVILHVKKIKKNNSDWLQLKISDTGIGISEENIPLIFDRFFQGDGTSTRKEEGTGIGLALTKELIEMMDGHIALESELNKGTDFLVVLPIKLNKKTSKKGKKDIDLEGKQNEKESNTRTIVPLDLHELKTNTDSPSLLIIEDNKDVVTYIQGLLQQNYRIEIAKNGQEGIDKALAIVPDIIISDVMMPEKDGYQVCTALKNDERTSHIPIILLTAKATMEDRVEGLKGGADAYLTKPFNKEELFVRLEQLVTIRKTLQERYSKTNFFTHEKKAKATLSLDDIFLQKLIKVVQPRIDDTELSVADLCKAVKLSNTHVNRKLKALTGKTPSQFIRSIRLQKAFELLQTTDQTISQIAYNVGFNDPNYFSRSFSEEFGFSPKSTRK